MNATPFCGRPPRLGTFRSQPQTVLSLSLFPDEITKSSGKCYVNEGTYSQKDRFLLSSHVQTVRSFYVCAFVREGVGGEVRKLEREQSRVIERNRGEQNIRGEKI